MDVSSLKITLPQSKSLQPVAEARRSTACLLALFGCSSPAMNICISQTVHNRPKTAKEVGCSPYLIRRVERVLLINSANSFVLFPCRTTRAPCRIAPLTLPIILEFMSPLLLYPQWNVIPSTCLRSWKTIFNKSDNTLSQISPVRHNIKEWMPTSLVTVIN